MHGFGTVTHVLGTRTTARIVAHLTAQGIRAFAPYVTPYETVAERAALWQAHLARVMDRCGCDRLNLIGFSMGGLDARYLISVLGGHAYAASLITVSTPHHGSTLADFILARPQLVQAFIIRAMDQIGNRVYQDSPSRARAALCELTPAFVTGAFNAEVPNHPAVAYWSYAAAAGRGTRVPINPVLRVPNQIIYSREGLNDGIVSVQSARWTRFMGLLEADHAGLIGVQSGNRGFDSLDFYVSLATLLAQEGL